MQKKANISPLEATLVGLLSGAGLYGVHRGVENLSASLAGRQTQPQTLVIPIPAEKLNPHEEKEKQVAQAGNPMTASSMQATAEAEKVAENALVRWPNVSEKLKTLAGGAGGAVLGYTGLSTINEQMKKKQIEDEKNKVQQDYLTKLKQVADQNKFASCTDCFCAGVVDKLVDASLEKSADPLPPTPLAYSQPPNILDYAGRMTNSFAKNVGTAAHGAWNTAKGAIRGGTGDTMDTAAAAAIALAALTGAGVYGLGTYANSKKKSPEDSSLPTNVEIKLVS